MKRLLLYFGIVLALAVLIFAGIKYAKHKRVKELPVYDSVTIYPDLEFDELVNMADTIVYGKVVKVGKSYYENIPVSITEKASEVSGQLKNLVTPIEIEVKTSLKGNERRSITYIEEGGITDTYIQKPSGYSLDKNREVVIFLNEKGYSWGELSVFPISGEKVILNETACEYLGNSLIMSEDVSKIDRGLKEQIKDQEIRVMDKNDFIAAIEKIVR
jgi:hypothetical protein